MAEKQKILIVDDLTSNIKILHDVLKQDYTLFFATNAKDAIQSIKLKNPDLILLDIIMPDLDGYSVCKKLKSDPETSHIPIIFITAKNSPEDEAKGFEIGGVDYIVKPFNRIVVLARVKNQISLHWHKQQLEQPRQQIVNLMNELKKTQEALALFLQ